MGNAVISERNRPACSLVIRCFNEELHIGRLLAGVMAQTVSDVEIILVDSGSTDATLAIASRYPVKIVGIPPKEFSFGRSINIGCAAASGEVIVIVSAHVYPVYKDWLEKILDPFKDHDVAIVYGKQRGNEKARFSEQQIYRKWFPEESANRQDHPFCNNANAAIRRSVWEVLPYDEELTGLEDLDWAKRVVRMGKKISYRAEAEIIHVHNETPSKVYNRYKREAIAFKRIFPHEHFNIKDFLKLFTANLFMDYSQAFREGMLIKNILSIPGFRFLQFWGTYSGFRQCGNLPEQLRKRFYYPNDFPNTCRKGTDDSDRRINYEHN